MPDWVTVYLGFISCTVSVLYSAETYSSKWTSHCTVSVLYSVEIYSRNWTSHCTVSVLYFVETYSRNWTSHCTVCICVILCWDIQPQLKSLHSICSILCWDIQWQLNKSLLQRKNVAKKYYNFTSSVCRCIPFYVLFFKIKINVNDEL